MNKTIKLTENELNRLISESVKRVLNEECDEGLLGNLRDKIGGTLDALRHGGNAGAHIANRQLNRSRNDIENLKNQYGVQNGMNGRQYVNQQVQDAVAQINAKYDQKMQQLEMQRNAEIEKVTGKTQAKATKKWDKYQGKKIGLDNKRDEFYHERRKAMNTNPYADFAE